MTNQPRVVARAHVWQVGRDYRIDLALHRECEGKYVWYEHRAFEDWREGPWPWESSLGNALIQFCERGRVYYGRNEDGAGSRIVGLHLTWVDPNAGLGGYDPGPHLYPERDGA